MRRDFERVQRRFMLDSVPDFSTDGGSLSFRQSFDVFESPETYFRAPDDIVEQGRRLLDLDLVDTLAKHVHDNVTVRIGAEGPYEQLSSTSVVTTGYGPGDDALAALGVVGPTRMDDPTNMAAVRAVARYVGQLLAEN